MTTRKKQRHHPNTVNAYSRGGIKLSIVEGQEEPKQLWGGRPDNSKNHGS